MNNVNCSYCNEQSEFTLSVTHERREFGQKTETAIKLPVCKSHLRILRKIGADAIWKNKLFNSQKLNDYLEYLLNAEDTLEKRPKLNEKTQSKLI